MEFSHILVLAQNQNQFQLITELMEHYFPYQKEAQQEKKLITISNKYYKANIKISSEFWNKIKQQSSINQVNQNQNKIDLMVMYVQQNQQPSSLFNNLDQIIGKFNPEEFVLLFHTQQPDNIFDFQQIILQKCDNFIEIIKENVHKINQIKPHWNKNTLLNAQQNQQFPFFSLLDRMQTTTWSTLVNNDTKAKQKSNNQKIELKKQDIEENVNQQKIQDQNIIEKDQQHIPNQKKEQEQRNDMDIQQEDQDKMEREMIQFESMMNEMLSLKMMGNNLSDKDRKAKAESIFNKLTKSVNI